MRRALVIHPGALGDVLLAVPALRGLRAAAPEATVVVAAQPRLARLLVSLGVIDEGLDVEALGLHGLFAGVLEAGGPPQIRAADRVISWFGSGDETFVRSLRAVQPTAVVASPSGGVGLVWQQLRRTLGLPATGDTEAIEVTPVLREAGRAALASTGWDGTSPLVVLQPGAGGEAKRWPPESFAAVALGILGRRRASLVVHEGPADAGAGASLRARLPVPTLRLVEPTLPVLAGALAHAALYLGNDSGVSHLAAAVGAPSVILFAEAQLSWRPWATHARVVIVSRPAATVDEVAAVAAAAQAAMA